ncbi:MAG: transcription termination/antitermination factor NusG [Chlamydiae bacterium]|nr:transcription termination/antitermination factor NusG [Chlamydiota bacterium]MBI3266649.1 transcription termination/antitermination factor NusG [Chlamydiota bacterium]
MPAKWYVIHTLSGQEQKVKEQLERKVALEAMQEKIADVLVPIENVSEVRAGKKKITKRKFFPGYILVQMDLNDDSWYLVKNTPGVIGFVGAGTPVPLLESEIQSILNQIEEKKEKVKPKILFEKGETIKVNDGPFVNFNGVIEELDPDRGKLKVMVTIFGRATPVELEYWQVEKA